MPDADARCAWAGVPARVHGRRGSRGAGTHDPKADARRRCAVRAGGHVCVQGGRRLGARGEASRRTRLHVWQARIGARMGRRRTIIHFNGASKRLMGGGYGLCAGGRCAEGLLVCR
eukprot:354921-Chlamydomonas_euryale.AAC.19